jgi:hypothetical protein
MIKRIIAVAFFYTLTNLYANEIDFRQVIFGNAYENIIEVDSNDFFNQFPETRNIEDYGQGEIINQIKYKEKHFPNDLSYLIRWYDENLKLDEYFIYSKEKKYYFRIFKEQYGNYIFYRMLVSLYELDDEKLLDWQNNYYEQELFYQISDDELIHVGSYTYRYPVGTQGGTFPVYNNVEIIQRKNKVNGIIVYNFYNAQTTMMDWETTWQGHEGAYYSINDILTIENNSSKSIKSAGLSLNSYDTESQLPSKSMFIGMPNPLIDSKRPFMYTLQNAFDGNKTTSYVEATENSLFEISVFVEMNVEKIAIINGYASNLETYLDNNQVKQIRRDIYKVIDKNPINIGKIEKELSTNNLNYQIFTWNENPNFMCSDIYKGKKYNDTCLAEINFYTTEKGWIFGEIDE